jgi:energy-coupling factor transport system ATP-binding protein
MALIKFDQFWWRYKSSEDWVLKDINLEVKEGEFLAITGPSGVGKSTFCLALNGVIPHTFKGRQRGDVFINGQNTFETGVATLSRDVGMVFQDPESQFFGLSVEEEITFGLENMQLERDEMKKRMDWALETVLLAGSHIRSPYELSGGQKQRVAVAAALAMSPKILVLDEPTSELDPIGKSEVFSVLSEIRKNRKMTIILVSHNTEEIAHSADRVIFIDNGEIKLEAPPEEFFTNVDILKRSGVEPPQVVEFNALLLKDGLYSDKIPVTLKDTRENIKRFLGGI